MFSFDFVHLTPGQGGTINEVSQPVGLTWGPLNQLRMIGGFIDGSARDAGNTGYTTTLRPGLLLGRIRSGADSGKFIQWSPTATDGSNRIAGVLIYAQNMQMMGADSDRLTAGIYVGGPLKASGLQIPSLTTVGIAGTTLEYLIRSQMAPYFQLDDDLAGAAGLASYFTNGAGNLTVTEALHNTHFFNTALANYTLPATPKLGLRYKFTNLADVNMTITAGTADTMIAYNDVTADSVAISTSSEKVGATFEVIGTGTAWLVIPALWEGQTPTIAT